ncbi:MAG: hypothetical protein ACXVCP_13380 [Bdellovibrio sp.]
MEILKNKKLSFPTRLYKHVVAVLGITLMLAACYNDSQNVVPPIYGFGCQNCMGVMPSPVPLTYFQFKSTDGKILFTNMQMYVQAGGVQPNASGLNYKHYTGPVAVQGTMMLAEPKFDYNPQTGQIASGCVVPAGTYNLQTQMVGQMRDGGVDIVIPSIITTVGGIQLQIQALSPMGFTDEGQRLWTNVRILRVNGLVCSQYFYGEFN